ncbi:MAG: S8 family serine peptidase [Anaerolineae bacterium]|nr:S8 family serine peptidase [Anaerolineae bacterium]
MVTILAWLACLGAFSAAASASPTTELLVKLSPQELEDGARALSARSIEGWTPVGVPGWLRVRVPEQQLERVRARLEHTPGVLAVHTDHPVRVALVPDDTYWPSQWALAKINAPDAWDLTTGRVEVVIAVLDTGMELSHPDLSGQVWVNPGETPGNGIDDDANGKVDDLHGWQFLEIGESSNVSDDYGHGTHVSGIIAAAGNNGTGVAGMAWGSRLMVVKVLDNEGNGRYSDVAAGLVYAADNGAQVINVSLGGDEDLPVLRDAVDYARARGALIVAAAGNYCRGQYVLFPAAYGNTIAVAASDRDDRLAYSSCRGPEVDLTAPGESVYSTCLGGGYCSSSGTSMAAPHVSGLAALIWSHHPEYAPGQVRHTMWVTAEALQEPYTGWGRIDAGRALSLELYVLHFPSITRGADP